jgi:hypothetical protein
MQLVLLDQVARPHRKRESQHHVKSCRISRSRLRWLLRLARLSNGDQITERLRQTESLPSRDKVGLQKWFCPFGRECYAEFYRTSEPNSPSLTRVRIFIFGLTAAVVWTIFPRSFIVML